MPTGRFLLIRHGQSTWNASGRWQGRADPALSDHGVEQAAHAASLLATIPGVAAITSSQLDRARTTAEILAAGTGLDLLDPVPDFQERHIGPWEGLTRVDIEERWPGFLSAQRRPDGVETDDAVCDRAYRGAEHLSGIPAASTGIGVVTHGGVIIAVERAAGRLDDGPIPNLNARWFRWDGDKLTVDSDRIDLAAGFVPTADEVGYA